ncbi:MAG TPA: hypothetical protein VFW74_19575 [Acidimicrobiia bacterium]|nr:hypothetical protein [Acidimicrobiia bacterium]
MLVFPLRPVPPPRPEDPVTVVQARSRESGTVLVIGPTAHVAMTCGVCGRVLTTGVVPGQLHAMVLHCNGCGAFNHPEAIPGVDD